MRYKYIQFQRLVQPTSKYVNGLLNVLGKTQQEKLGYCMVVNVFGVSLGSVNAKNCENIAKVENVDGFLVGGASLNASDFAHIANLKNI